MKDLGWSVDRVRGLYRSPNNFKGTSKEILEQQLSHVRPSKRDATASYQLHKTFRKKSVVHVT